MPVVGSNAPQDSSTSASKPLVRVYVALAVVGALSGLALFVFVAFCLVRRRARIHRTREEAANAGVSKSPVQGVRTPADAWAGMATFETVMYAAAEVKIRVDVAVERKLEAAVHEKAAADENAAAQDATSVIEQPMTTSSSWVIEQDLTELWEHARRDASRGDNENDSDGE